LIQTESGLILRFFPYVKIKKDNNVFRNQVGRSKRHHRGRRNRVIPRNFATHKTFIPEERFLKKGLPQNVDAQWLGRGVFSHGNIYKQSHSKIANSHTYFLPLSEGPRF